MQVIQMPNKDGVMADVSFMTASEVCALVGFKFDDHILPHSLREKYFLREVVLMQHFVSTFKLNTPHPYFYFTTERSPAFLQPKTRIG